MVLVGIAFQAPVAITLQLGQQDQQLPFWNNWKEWQSRRVITVQAHLPIHFTLCAAYVNDV